jgi:hypothetical protein
VAVAMDPVKVSANNDMMAKVRIKMIMAAPAFLVGTRMTNHRLLFSVC